MFLETFLKETRICGSLPKNTYNFPNCYTGFNVNSINSMSQLKIVLGS